jgi:hypothetical protein
MRHGFVRRRAGMLPKDAAFGAIGALRRQPLWGFLGGRRGEDDRARPCVLVDERTLVRSRAYGGGCGGPLRARALEQRAIRRWGAFFAFVVGASLLMIEAQVAGSSGCLYPAIALGLFSVGLGILALRRGDSWIRAQSLACGLCPSCGGVVAGLTREQDGHVACATCQAAWLRESIGPLGHFRAPPIACVACGYDLAGLAPGATCSECGGRGPSGGPARAVGSVPCCARCGRLLGGRRSRVRQLRRDGGRGVAGGARGVAHGAR